MHTKGICFTKSFAISHSIPISGLVVPEWPAQENPETSSCTANNQLLGSVREQGTYVCAWNFNILFWLRYFGVCVVLFVLAVVTINYKIGHLPTNIRKGTVSKEYFMQYKCFVSVVIGKQE